jgi:hypothetical protein
MQLFGEHAVKASESRIESTPLGRSKAMSGKTRPPALPAILAVAIVIVGFVLPAPVPAASTLWSDTRTVEAIIEIGTNDNQVMDHLYHLTDEIGMRPAGSKAHHETAEWAYEKFKEFGLSNVHLEQCGDWPGYPDGEWAEGFLDKLSRMVRIGDEEVNGGEKRVPIYNVVADITGTEKPDEYVIVGAHYDSVPIGAGALDNGTGVAAAMEAARILMEADAKPKRTIRFVLFAGEESGMLGSRRYVEAHPELIPKISAMYNMDHGTNYISGVQATGPLKDDMDAVFAPVPAVNPEMRFEVAEVDWLLMGDPNCCDGGQMTQLGENGPMVVMHAYKQMPDGSLKRINDDPAEIAELEASTSVAEAGSTGKRVVMLGGCAPGCGGDMEFTIEDLKQMGVLSDDDIAEMTTDSTGTRKMKTVALGSSDQTPFLAAGVPGFWWAQDGDSTVTYPVHTKSDTYDKAIPEYMEYNATVIAIGALGTANLNHMLSREKLTAPRESEGKDEACPATIGEGAESRKRRVVRGCAPGC